MEEKFNYQRYLASREWALKKEQVRERSRGACERCGVGKYESTHHVTYERIGNELLEDLLAVCNDCHEFLSGKSDTDPVERVVLFVGAVNIDWLKDHIDEFAAGLSAGRARIVADLTDNKHVSWLPEIEDLEFAKRLKPKEG